jgi:thioredoxin 1
VRDFRVWVRLSLIPMGRWPCRSCGSPDHKMDELATDLAGTVKVAKLNVDENPGTAARLGIQSIPTLLLFRNGDVLDQMIGAAPRARIEAAIRRPLRDQ